MSLPRIIIYVEGGLVQGVRATEPMECEIFDMDDYGALDEEGQADMRERFGIPTGMDIETWWSDTVPRTHSHGIH